MRLHEIRRVLRPRGEVFAYAADFVNTQDWDPAVVSARQVEPGPLGVGTKFELEVKVGPTTIPMTYWVTEIEPDYRVVLEGRSRELDAVDEIRFIADGENTVIDYTARLTFHNFVRLVQPLARPFLRRAGARAVDGLVAELEG